MKFHYYPETDSLYIDLSKKSSAESREISEGVVADYGEDGKIVGIDIDQASEIVDLSCIEAESLPVQNFAISQAHTHSM